MAPTARRNHTVSKTLSLNLHNAFKVAGTADDDDALRKLTHAHMHRTTGIARSTLQTLSTLSPPFDANPDLQTLCRIADELQIPVAFLLMGPREWRTLLKAFVEISSADFQAAAANEESEKGLRGAQAALSILRKTEMYPLPRPIFSSEHDAEQIAALNKQNDALRRATLVTAAILQTGVSDAHTLKALTVLAATHVNNDKSRFLSSI